MADPTAVSALSGGVCEGENLRLKCFGLGHRAGRGAEEETFTSSLPAFQPSMACQSIAFLPLPADH